MGHILGHWRKRANRITRMRAPTLDKHTKPRNMARKPSTHRGPDGRGVFNIH